MNDNRLCMAHEPQQFIATYNVKQFEEIAEFGEKFDYFHNTVIPEIWKKQSQILAEVFENFTGQKMTEANANLIVLKDRGTRLGGIFKDVIIDGWEIGVLKVEFMTKDWVSEHKINIVFHPSEEIREWKQKHHGNRESPIG